MPRPASLSLATPKSTSVVSSAATSPADAVDVRSNLSSPVSNSGEPTAEKIQAGAQLPDRGVAPPQTSISQSAEIDPSSPEITSLPPFPPSPKKAPKYARESSKSFFSNLKASKSSNKVHALEPTIRQVSEDRPRTKVEPQDGSIYSASKSNSSSPDLSLAIFEASPAEAHEVHDMGDHQAPRGMSIPSDNLGGTSPIDSRQPKKPKPRFTHLLNRTLSIKMDDGGRKSKPSTPLSATSPRPGILYDTIIENENLSSAPRTAPLQPDRSLREMMNSEPRNRSADRDRQHSNRSQESVAAPRRAGTHGQGLTNSTSGMFRGDGAGSHLFSNFRNKAISSRSTGLSKAKGMFGKSTRSASSTRQEDEPFVFRVLHLPLREQTRETRIAARLEDSKDKTEFWMASLPWRCIDFLNFRGCEEEGLYRIPGSEVQVRHWQRRFDRERDINLFNEPDLYDVNIIGSMFKAWLRDLPTEILPKEIQNKVAKECSNSAEVPQMFKDALSLLPPWNYYLLFAITCHLSLLIAYSETNKMSYTNLCICFQPALKIDGLCFNYLVNHWRCCWQGCLTERDYLVDEYRILDGRLPPSSGESSVRSMIVAEERSIPSSASNKPNLSGRPPQGRPPPLTLTTASDEELAAPKTPNGNMTAVPELSPVKPLSPLMGSDEY